MNKSVQNPAETVLETPHSPALTAHLSRLEGQFKVLNASHSLCQSNMTDEHLTWLIEDAQRLIIEVSKVKTVIWEGEQ